MKVIVLICKVIKMLNVLLLEFILYIFNYYGPGYKNRIKKIRYFASKTIQNSKKYIPNKNMSSFGCFQDSQDLLLIVKAVRAIWYYWLLFCRPKTQ